MKNNLYSTIYAHRSKHEKNVSSSIIILFDSLEIRVLRTLDVKHLVKNYITSGITMFLFDEIQVRKDYWL